MSCSFCIIIATNRYFVMALDQSRDGSGGKLSLMIDSPELAGKTDIVIKDDVSGFPGDDKRWDYCWPTNGALHQQRFINECYRWDKVRSLIQMIFQDFAAVGTDSKMVVINYESMTVHVLSQCASHKFRTKVEVHLLGAGERAARTEW